MPGQIKNIIQKQIIDLVVSDKNKAGFYYDDAKNLYYTELLPVIDQVLSEFSGIDQRIIIDTLYLDLGLIQAGDLKNSFKTILKKHLSEYLKANIGKPFSTSEDILYFSKNQKSRDLEILIFYLNTGNIPWWALHEEKIEWKEIWISSLEKDTVEFYNEVKNVLNQNTGFERIISFLDDDLFFKSISVFSVYIPEKLIIGFIRLLKSISSLNRIPVKELILVLKKSYLSILKKTAFSDFQYLKPEQLISEFIIQVDIAFNNPVKQIIEEIFSIDVEKVHEYIPVKVFTSIKEFLSGLSQVNGIQFFEGAGRELKFIERQKRAEHKQGKKDKISVKNNKKTSSESLVPENIDTNRTGELINEQKVETVGEEELKKTGQITEDENIFYIRNAGLVLLWPYLNNFFKATGILKEGKWASSESKQLAVHALQYMVNFNNQCEEHECLLPKILCGFHYNDFINIRLKLNKKISIECKELLTAVIKNWSVLKNTSVEGFRNSFLSREGKLQRTESGWKLTVQRKSFDVLLENLPWSISIIKFSWMEKPLYVEW